MALDYQFYKENFGSQFLKEKPGTAQSFKLNVSGLYVDDSLNLKVIQVWNHMFEHDEDISAVLLGDRVLYQGKLDEYDSLVSMFKNQKYELGLDEKANLYLLREAEIIE
ncbi:hypothetical protein HOA91_02310 [Candidatus Woesearchaeota archaeon]|jgi:hypothetical protein|nr:hypothetical protein [Candidatus Woesearchaeota archaeon]